MSSKDVALLTAKTIKNPSPERYQYHVNYELRCGVYIHADLYNPSQKILEISALCGDR